MSNGAMIADRDHAGCQIHRGDLCLLPLVESLMTYFTFFYI